LGCAIGVGDLDVDGVRVGWVGGDCAVVEAYEVVGGICCIVLDWSC